MVELVIRGDGPKQALIALTPTQFSGNGVTLDFVKDKDGKFNEVIAHIVEGDIKAGRKNRQP